MFHFVVNASPVVVLLFRHPQIFNHVQTLLHASTFSKHEIFLPSFKNAIATLGFTPSTQYKSSICLCFVCLMRQSHAVKMNRIGARDTVKSADRTSTRRDELPNLRYIDFARFRLCIEFFIDRENLIEWYERSSSLSDEIKY